MSSQVIPTVDGTLFPDHVRTDPHPGKNGGKFVLITCQSCGRVFRWSLGVLIAHVRKRGKFPLYCSRKCSSASRRRCQ